MDYGTWSKSESPSNTCAISVVDSLVLILIYLAVYCKARKANFTSFPANYPDKARAIFKLYLGVRSQLKRKRSMVFMLIGDRDHCRAPFVYFFTRALQAEEQKQLLLHWPSRTIDTYRSCGNGRALRRAILC